MEKQSFKNGDAGGEIAQALRVMGQVLVKQDTHTRKREIKFKTKDQKQEGGSLVDQIFKPETGVFKGETPVVGIDCEMVQVQGNTDALAR